MTFVQLFGPNFSLNMLTIIVECQSQFADWTLRENYVENDGHRCVVRGYQARLVFEPILQLFSFVLHIAKKSLYSAQISLLSDLEVC